MDDNMPFEQAVGKGHHFLTRDNFFLAKQYFESALRLREAPEIRDAIALCDRGLITLKRKDTLKKGRRLEQKGKWDEALLCFKQASDWEEEGWVTDKISALQQKMTLSAVTEQMRKVADSDDLELKLATYNRALALDPSVTMINGKAACLLHLQRPDEVVALYDIHPPTDDRGCYLLGLALAHQGRLGEAVLWWERVTVHVAEILEQWRGWVPFVYRALHAVPPGPPHIAVYRWLRRLQADRFQADLTPYEPFFHAQALAAWWQGGLPDEHRDLLHPWPPTLTRTGLGRHAQLYFQLAQRDVNCLETAISLWLTAVYQDALLDSLAAHVLFATPVDRQELRDRLLLALERVLDAHERAGGLPSGIRVLWRVEKRSIEALSRLAPTGERPELFPCTAGLADRLGLSTRIWALLQRPDVAREAGEEWFQVLLAAFSPFRLSLVWLEQGEEEKALAHLATLHRAEQKGLCDAVQAVTATYCRQRIHWALAIKAIRKGDKGVRKWLTIALPLVHAYPVYAEELIPLAYEDLEPHALMELGEIMERLVPRVCSRPFREATAHLLGIKALQLVHNASNYRSVEALLERADTICRDTEMVKTARENLKKKVAFDQLDAAFRKRNTARAAQVVQEANDPEVKAAFFETMEMVADAIGGWEEKDRLVPLRELCTHCREVDPDHAVTRRIERKLQLLQEE